MSRYNYNNYLYYRRHWQRRKRYFQDHHGKWKNMKKLAKKLQIRLPEARNLIDKALRPWYIQVGILDSTPPRKRRYSKTGKHVWRTTEPDERQPPPLGRDGQSLD